MVQEVVKVEGIRTVDSKLVETLEDLLKNAKNGRLQSIMFIDYYFDNKCGHGWSGNPPRRMIAELEELKFDYFSQMHFLMEDED